MAVNEKAYEKQRAPDAVIRLSGAFAVLEAGLEPAQPQWPRDFKSLVSTDSTIRACRHAKVAIFCSAAKHCFQNIAKGERKVKQVHLFSMPSRPLYWSFSSNMGKTHGIAALDVCFRKASARPPKKYV